MIATSARHPWVQLLLVVVPLLLVGCDQGGGSGAKDPNAACLNTENLKKGAERGSIEALTDPPVLDPDDVENLRDSDRVVALLVGSTPLAVPHKLLNQHEIVNLDDWLDKPIIVTHCPLTKSSLAFEREAVNGAEFDVSGLLLHSNLMMVDRRDNESLWPQMQRSAVCGPASGTTLDMLPVLDVTWGYWRSLHPGTKVLPVTVNDRSSGQRGRGHSVGSGASVSKGAPSGLVLGLPRASLGGNAPKSSGRGGVAVPFRALNDGGAVRTVELSAEGPVVFWRREAQAAMAFGVSESFSVTEDGQIVDDQTGSVWTLDGRAVEGRRAGEQLPPVETAYVALWRAWSDFHPNTDVWSDGS